MTKFATEKGLVELGKQMVKIDTEKQRQDVDRLYLTSTLEDLSDFDSASFISSLKLGRSKNIEKIHQHIAYIPMFNRLCAYYKKDILLLESTALVQI